MAHIHEKFNTTGIKMDAPLSLNGFNQFGIPKTQNRILRRLDRLTRGNFGECKSVGGGVFELILDFGPGYRIYFSEIGNIVVLLLCGGDKGSQIRDIERAKMYWREYKEVNQ